MPYNPAPKAFFGPSYALTGSAIVLPTVNSGNVEVGAFTALAAAATLTFLTAHNLKVGDKVAVTTSAADLPAPFTETVYYVLSVPAPTTLTLSLTKGGAVITATDVGSGTHTIHALGVLQDVTDVEAHADDGDFRKIIYGLQEMMYQKWINTPAADRPTKVTITRASSTNEATGAITRFYTTTIVTDPTAIEVRPE